MARLPPNNNIYLFIIAGEKDQYAYVYDLQNNTWVPTGILDGKQRPSFAEHIIFEGNVALVGVPRADPTYRGSFQIFELNTTLNEWVEIGGLTFNGASTRNYFGNGGAKHGDMIFTAPRGLPDGVGALVYNLTGVITPVSESPLFSSTESPQVSRTSELSYTSMMGAECLGTVQ